MTMETIEGAAGGDDNCVTASQLMGVVVGDGVNGGDGGDKSVGDGGSGSGNSGADDGGELWTCLLQARARCVPPSSLA